MQPNPERGGAVRRHFVVMSLGLCAGLSGQISPTHFAAAETPSSSRSPLSQISTSRTLQIHEDVARSLRPIVAMAFRRDGVRRETFGSLSLTLSISMSTGVTSAAVPNATFDLNHGTDRATVVATRTVSFPATLPVTTLPAPFDYEIPFDVPFTYGIRTTGPLVWDMVTQAGTIVGTPPAFDFVVTPGDANPDLAVFDFGTGCLATGQTQLMGALASENANWPAGTVRIDVGCVRGPASAPGVAMIGVSNSSLGGIPLPFVLPGSAGAPSGPCSVLIDPVVTLPVALGPSGTRSVPMDIAATLAVHGGTLFNQMVAFDPLANPMGLVTSDGRARQLIAPYAPVAVGRVEAIGNTGPTGIVSPNRGVVTRFLR